MVVRKGGPRRRTRSKLSKHYTEKGKISLSRYFQVFNEGDRVMLVPEPAVHKGLYHQRYMGKTGIIKRKVGKCYEVTIMDQNKQKCIITYPIHLTRAK